MAATGTRGCCLSDLPAGAGPLALCTSWLPQHSCQAVLGQTFAVLLEVCFESCRHHIGLGEVCVCRLCPTADALSQVLGVPRSPGASPERGRWRSTTVGGGGCADTGEVAWATFRGQGRWFRAYSDKECKSRRLTVHGLRCGLIKSLPGSRGGGRFP